MGKQQKKPSITDRRRTLAKFFDLPLRSVKTRRDPSLFCYDTAKHIVSYVVEQGWVWQGEYIVLSEDDLNLVARLCALDLDSLTTSISLEIGKVVCRKTRLDFNTQIRLAVPDCPEEQIAEILTRYRDTLQDPRLLRRYFHRAIPICTNNNPEYWIVKV